MRIDLNTGRTIPVAFAHQNDTNRQLTFQLYNNGVAFTPSSTTVKFAYKSPIVNGRYSVITGSQMASGTVSGNTVTVTLPAQYTQVSGVGLLTMILTTSGNTLRPVNIKFVCQGSADGDDTILNASDWPDGLYDYMDNWLAENEPTEIANLKSDLLELQNGGYVADAQRIGEVIDDWLDDHPESTTTVQDGSITEAKLAEALQLKTVKDYITPQMYGAKADGTTDDTAAIQSAVNAATESVPLFFPKGTYKVTDEIDINTSNITIYSSPINECFGRLLVSSGAFNVFNINASGVTIRNIGIEEQGAQCLATGIFIKRTDGTTDAENSNLDVSLHDLHLLNLNIGIEYDGKNVNVYDSLISGCNVGIKVNNDTTAEVRGLECYRNRFHGIGVNSNYSADTCCIKMPGTASNTLQRVFNIKNNFADYSNTFIKGSLCGCNICNNTIYGGYTSFIDGFGAARSYHNKPTIIDGNNFASIMQNSAAMEGRVLKGVIVDSSHFIKITNNVFTNTSQNPIELSNCTGAIVQNNEFTRSPNLPTQSGYTNAYPYMVIDACENIVIDGNTLSDDNNINASYAYDITNTGWVYMGKNHLRATNGEHKNSVTNVKPYGYYNIPVFGTYVATKQTTSRTDVVSSITLPSAGTYLLGVMFECTARPILLADTMRTDGNTYNSFASGSLVPCTVTQQTTINFFSGTNASQTYYYARAYAVKIA